MDDTNIIVLAAGKGTRMQSALPKVLHLLAGRSMLSHVLDTASSLPGARLSVVAGHGIDLVQDELRRFEQTRKDDHAFLPISCIEQKEQLGTGHAVLQAAPSLAEQGVVLVLYGDVPLIESHTLEHMVRVAKEGRLALLSVELNDPTGYGRIVRDSGGRVQGIVEQKDASEDQLSIQEVNTGIMAMPGKNLKQWLPQLTNNNAQGEYYLTDIVSLAARQKVPIQSLQAKSIKEVEGVNSRAQLASLERHYQMRLAEELMNAGVAFADPARFDCRGTLQAKQDVFIDINCVFAGEISLGRGVNIGPNCTISEAVIGDNVVIKANSVIEGPVIIEAGAQVGPFARLREGSVLRENVKVGNFVETKKTELGTGSKASHLSYLGDSKLGEEVNIGAGTITCNYDGANKHVTDIGDRVFVGSNSSLVAPIKIGKDATIGAGSTITRDVPAQSLSVARVRQKNIEQWQRTEEKGVSQENRPEISKTDKAEK